MKETGMVWSQDDSIIAFEFVLVIFDNIDVFEFWFSSMMKTK